MDWKFNVYIILNSYCNICFLCFLDIKIKMYTWWLQQAWNFKLYTRVFHHSLVIKRSTNWALCWSLVTKFIWYIYIYIYMMRTEYFFFVHHTTIILGKLSTWCFEHDARKLNYLFPRDQWKKMYCQCILYTSISCVIYLSCCLMYGYETSMITGNN